MHERERRAEARRTKTVAVSVMVTGVELEGHTLNLSPHGVLVQARGNIPLVLTISGQQYRGFLVRAVPSVDGTTSYAIELPEGLETS